MHFAIRSSKRMCGALFVVALLVLARSTTRAQQFTPSPTPQVGKALVYVYREASFVGKAGWSRIFVNADFLASLHSGDYAAREVPEGTVVFMTVPRGIPITAVLAFDDMVKKRHERLRINVEAGKTYYVRWFVGDKVKLVDEA